MKFRLELRDRNFNVLEILDKEYMDLRWAYSRNGGCGEIGFTLPRKLFEEQSIIGGHNLRLYLRNDDTKAYDLRYQGVVETKSPNVLGNSEKIAVTGHGYVSQLRNVYISDGVAAKTYDNQEVSVIVKDLLDNFIVPDTDITYVAAQIPTTNFTVDLIEFNTNASNAMRTLADLLGDREWGVDKNREFFFKKRETAVGLRFSFGKDITKFQETQDFRDIVNRAVVQGAESGGTFYGSTHNDVPSQDKYGIKTEVIQNSSIITDAVAAQFATALFAEKGDVTFKTSCELVDYAPEIEATNPIAVVNFLGRRVRYGQKKYGKFKYSGPVNRLVNRINYSVSNNNIYRVRLDLGGPRPSLSEQIARLEFNLEQQRSASF